MKYLPYGRPRKTSCIGSPEQRVLLFVSSVPSYHRPLLVREKPKRACMVGVVGDSLPRHDRHVSLLLDPCLTLFPKPEVLSGPLSRISQRKHGSHARSNIFLPSPLQVPTPYPYLSPTSTAPTRQASPIPIPPLVSLVSLPFFHSLLLLFPLPPQKAKAGRANQNRTGLVPVADDNLITSRALTSRNQQIGLLPLSQGVGSRTRSNHPPKASSARTELGC